MVYKCSGLLKTRCFFSFGGGGIKGHEMVSTPIVVSVIEISLYTHISIYIYNIAGCPPRAKQGRSVFKMVEVAVQFFFFGCIGCTYIYIYLH